VMGIGANIRDGQCRVKIPITGHGYAHNWYLFSQVREA
jgi:hypothetical protein